MIKQHQIYSLPSGAIVKVNALVAGTRSDWNCTYQHKAQLDEQVALTADFLRKFGEVWA